MSKKLTPQSNISSVRNPNYMYVFTGDSAITNWIRFIYWMLILVDVGLVV